MFDLESIYVGACPWTATHRTRANLPFLLYPKGLKKNAK